MSRRPKIDPGYQEQLNVQKYAAKQHQSIEQFIEQNNTTYIQLCEVTIELLMAGRIYAIIDPEIVAALDYEPVRQVSHIMQISPEEKAWFINYWEEKYEIDVSKEQRGDWEYKVGLLFEGSYWNSDYQYEVPYERTYDYPSCLIATFLLKPDEEDKQ